MWGGTHNAGENKKPCGLDWNEKFIKDQVELQETAEFYSTSDGETIQLGIQWGITFS